MTKPKQGTEGGGLLQSHKPIPNPLPPLLPRTIISSRTLASIRIHPPSPLDRDPSSLDQLRISASVICLAASLNAALSAAAFSAAASSVAASLAAATSSAVAAAAALFAIAAAAAALFAAAAAALFVAAAAAQPVSGSLVRGAVARGGRLEQSRGYQRENHDYDLFKLRKKREIIISIHIRMRVSQHRCSPVGSASPTSTP